MPVSGQIAVAGLFEWLKVLELNRRTVTLRLERPTGCGSLRLLEGRLVEARCGATAGDDAARQLLTWIDASFEQESSPDETPGDVTRSTCELVREAMAAAPAAPALDPRWRISGDLAAMSVAELCQLGALNRRGYALRLPEQAQMCFHDGRIVRATAGDVHDEEAVCQVLTLSAGPFEIAPLDEAPVGGFVGIAPDFLAEGVRRADEERPSPGEPAGGKQPAHGPRRQIRELSAAQKLALAHKGTRNERLILMRHPDRRIALAALMSSHTTDNDVEAIARATSANVDVLTAIAHHERYGHSYTIVRALVFNPKTPTAEAVRLVSRLREYDLRLACRDPDLAEPVRITIRKRMRALEVKRQF